MEGVKAVNPLWEFALDYYANQDIAQCLLALQDRDGYQVNVLIFTIWLTSKGLKLQKLPTKEQQVGRWHRDISVNIRALRQSVKRESSDNEALALVLASCYRKLLSAELAVEEVELMLLYQQHLQYTDVFEEHVTIAARLNDNLSYCWQQLKTTQVASDHKLRELQLLQLSLNYLQNT
ncbi:TIGR02444 family protein [Gammaproteobacteria bacterium AS21]|jgi:uncharacterized protein (TIGR02444 family)